MVDPSGDTPPGRMADNWPARKVGGPPTSSPTPTRTAPNRDEPPAAQRRGLGSKLRLRCLRAAGPITSPAGTFQYAGYYGFDLLQQINLPMSGGMMDLRNYDTLGRLTDTALYSANGADTQSYVYDLGSQRTQQNLTITDGINSIYSTITLITPMTTSAS